jgi:gas vesicle protein
MSEHSVPLEQEFGRGDSDEADPVVANLQQSANLANENCDRAVAVAQTLSAQLREAQDRINQLEREAEGLGDKLLAEAKAIIQEVRSNADARVNRTIREADERIDRLKAETQNQIGRLQNELAQATRGIDQVKDEAGTRIETVKKEADARVDAVETEAKKRVDVIRRENEDKVTRLEADLLEAKDRADRAEQWVMLIRREIEDHLMPAMRDGPKPTRAACPAGHAEKRGARGAARWVGLISQWSNRPTGAVARTLAQMLGAKHPARPVANVSGATGCKAMKNVDTHPRR